MKCISYMFKSMVLLMLLNAVPGKAQITSTPLVSPVEEIPVQKKLHFGFIADAQTGAVSLENPPQTNNLIDVPVVDNVKADGFKVYSFGALIEYDLNEKFSLGLKTKVAFNKYTLRFINDIGYDQEELKEAYLQLPIYLKYTYVFENTSPYFSLAFAPNVRLYEGSNSNLESTALFHEGSIKIGVDIEQQKIIWSPFLSLTKSLTNVYTLEHSDASSTEAFRGGLAFGIKVYH